MEHSCDSARKTRFKLADKPTRDKLTLQSFVASTFHLFQAIFSLSAEGYSATESPSAIEQLRRFQPFKISTFRSALAASMSVANLKSLSISPLGFAVSLAKNLSTFQLLRSALATLRLRRTFQPLNFSARRLRRFACEEPFNFPLLTLPSARWDICRTAHGSIWRNSRAC